MLKINSCSHYTVKKFYNLHYLKINSKLYHIHEKGNEVKKFLLSFSQISWPLIRADQTIPIEQYQQIKRCLYSTYPMLL